MRHAPQLCRGLAEASRSLDRPYIPRHVPLPSASYRIAAQVSAQTSVSKASATALDSNSAGNRSKDAASIGKAASNRGASPGQTDPLQPPLTRQFPRGAPKRSSTEAGRKVAQQLRSPLAKPKLVDGAARKHAAAASTTRPRLRGLRKHQNIGSSAAFRRPQARDRGKPARRSRPRAKKSRDAAHLRPGSQRRKPRPNLERLTAVYPGLSNSQARLLLQISRQIHALRSHAPNTLLSWYENFVWTTERQAEGTEKIESRQSISMLLRYAYQRNDLRSLTRIESRANLLSTTFRRPVRSATPTVSPKEQFEDKQIDGVGILPEPDEDPLRLAYNLKVAFAAKQGDWLMVSEFLDGTDRSSIAEAKLNEPPRKVLFARRPEALLDAIGWSSLVQFGLGDVRAPKAKSSSSASSTMVDGSASSAAGKRHQQQSAVSAPPIIATPSQGSFAENTEDRAAGIVQQEEEQAKAKFMVTKRLLPHLLRYTSTSTSKSTRTSKSIFKTNDKWTSSTQDSEADSASPQTPAWLLQSVLRQLIERGETASAIRIVLLAISEESVQEQNACIPGYTTNILNLSLAACERDLSVSMKETLRIFNRLTGSTLGVSLLGSTVLARPILAQGESVPLNVTGEQSDKQSQTRKVTGYGRRILPNEESLVLVLTKIRNPIFRASWARRLVQEFQRLFPKVQLTGRTYKKLIENCIGRTSRDVRQSSLDRVVSKDKMDPKDDRSNGKRERKKEIKQTLLAQILTEILTRFSSSSPDRIYLHRTTTNRRRFELTLARAKRALLSKKSIPNNNHHSTPSALINKLLTLLSDVQRLGRAQDSFRKKSLRAKLS